MFNMKLTRIVFYESPDIPGYNNLSYYEIQRKFWFGWCKAFSRWEGYSNRFSTLEEAQANVKFFDGSVPEYKVVG